MSDYDSRYKLVHGAPSGLDKLRAAHWVEDIDDGNNAVSFLELTLREKLHRGKDDVYCGTVAVSEGTLNGDMRGSDGSSGKVSGVQIGDRWFISRDSSLGSSLYVLSGPGKFTGKVYGPNAQRRPAEAFLKTLPDIEETAVEREMALLLLREQRQFF